MATGFTCKITGLEPVKQMLRDLPREISMKILRRTAATGAFIIRAEAVRRAPVFKGEYTYPYRKASFKPKRNKYGPLKKNIVVKWQKGHPPEVAIYRLGFTKNGFYGWILENGWIAIGPHRTKGVTARRSRELAQQSRGHHIPGKGFMRGAFDAMQHTAMKAMIHKCELLVGKAAVGKGFKLAKGTGIAATYTGGFELTGGM